MPARSASRISRLLARSSVVITRYFRDRTLPFYRHRAPA
jgi:hypothetical protein